MVSLSLAALGMPWAVTIPGDFVIFSEPARCWFCCVTSETHTSSTAVKEHPWCYEFHDAHVQSTLASAEMSLDIHLSESKIALGQGFLKEQVFGHSNL